MLSFRDSARADTRLVEWHGEGVGILRQVGAAAGAEVSQKLPVAGAAALIEHLRNDGVTNLATRTIPLRYAARQRGFGGALRGDLVFTGAEPMEFLDALRVFLPGVDVEEAPHRSALRSVIASAFSGVSGMTRLRFRHPEHGALTVLMPKRNDSIAEAVAIAVDTTFAVRARFGDAVAHVATISFDHSSAGLGEGKHAGEAPRHLGEIHINASYTSASGYEALGRAGRSGGSPLQLPAPWTHLDATIAHELWHKIELAWESERFTESVAFRREVGELFGCETIEKVFSSPDAVKRLAEGVTAYATTNRLEATAEMFELWWCGPPPAESIAAKFGAIIDAYF